MITTKSMLRSLGFACAIAASANEVRAQDIAVHAKILHTAEGAPIRDAIVVVQGGKIVMVGPVAAVTIPAGMRTLTVEVATPGLVDAHSVIGLAGHLNQPQDQDQHDPTAPIQPELRAIDAYNARERLVEWVRGFGVTTIHTGHAPQALISGQTLVAKTRGDTVEQAVIVPRAMVAATLGAESRAEGEGKSPGTAGKQLALLREALVGADAYRQKLAAAGSDATKRPDRDLRKETLVDVLDGKVPLLVTAQRHQDIASALRLQQEFGFRLVLDGAAEAYTLLDQLRAAKVPVILHPPMARFSGEMENASRATPAQMRAAGILFALQSGYESYVPKTRVVLYEAAIAAAHDLGADAALHSITIDAARILGLEARLGSLAVGKDGDLALYDGDPFEYTTHCVGTVIEGVVVFDGSR
jgi:imidazolonepropionase-like amidohydrolase